MLRRQSAICSNEGADQPETENWLCWDVIDLNYLCGPAYIKWGKIARYHCLIKHIMPDSSLSTSFLDTAICINVGFVYIYMIRASFLCSLLQSTFTMSPTSTVPILTETASAATTQYTKDQFASKQLILCYDTDAIVIQNVVLAFNYLIAAYPQWSSRIALVFFVNETAAHTKNVYFYPNLDKDVRDTLEALAVVKISLLSTSLDTNDTIPTLVALNHAQCPNQIAVDTTNYKQMADMLNHSLVSRLIFYFCGIWFLSKICYLKNRQLRVFSGWKTLEKKFFFLWAFFSSIVTFSLKNLFHLYDSTVNKAIKYLRAIQCLQEYSKTFVFVWLWCKFFFFNQKIQTRKLIDIKKRGL